MELGGETQGAFSEHEGETLEALSEHEEETQETLSQHEEKTQEALPEHEQEQQQKENEAGSAPGSAKLDAPTAPALRKLTINGNIPSILSSCSRSPGDHTSLEGAALHRVLPAIGEVYDEDDGEETLGYDDGGPMAMQATLDIPELIAGDMIPEPRNR